MPAQSRAEIEFRRLFADELKDAFVRLDALIANSDEENEWREFKEAKFFDEPLPAKNGQRELERRKKTVKKYWSEALSAFANSGGGILIWGIAAPKRKAENQSFPGDAEALADWLKQLQNDAVDPPVLGVEIRTAVEPGCKKGFVVCYIPNSSFSPHRANWADREYYIRAGDSNVPMRIEVLRRMFYPHTAPRLVPTVRLSVERGADGQLHVQMKVDLQNRGSASARETYVEVATRADPCFKPYPAQFWSERQFSQHGYDCENTIHPNETIPFLTNLAHAGGYADSGQLPTPLQCTFRIFTQHASALFAEVSFTGNEMEDAARQSTPISREGKTVLLDV